MKWTKLNAIYIIDKKIEILYFKFLWKKFNKKEFKLYIEYLEEYRRYFEFESVMFGLH